MSAEIDRMVAEKIMGWHIVQGGVAEIGDEPMHWQDETRSYMSYVGNWQPTQDIAQAWLVVERMRALRWGMRQEWDIGNKASVNFWKEGVSEWNTGESESPCRAICLAALAALGVAVGKVA